MTVSPYVGILLTKDLNLPVRQYHTGRKLFSQVQARESAELFAWVLCCCSALCDASEQGSDFVRVFLKSSWCGSLVLDQIIRVVNSSDSSLLFSVSYPLV